MSTAVPGGSPVASVSGKLSYVAGRADRQVEPRYGLVDPGLSQLEPDLGVPLVCAGGIGDERGFVEALRLGYAGVQLGTRFIATPECRTSQAYKQAIVRAREDDIVLTEQLSGIPVAVIRTPYIERMGLRAGPIARRLLCGRRTKHFMRTFYALRSVCQLKRALLNEEREYWQAGQSVRDIHEILPAGEIVRPRPRGGRRRDQGPQRSLAAIRLSLDFTHYDFGGDRHLRTGETLPEGAVDELRKHQAIYLGAIAHPGVKPGILEKGILLRLRFELDQYVNLRPVKLYPGVECPLKDKGPEHIDFVVVRENTEGLYAGAGGVLKKGTADEGASRSRSTRERVWSAVSSLLLTTAGRETG